MLTELRVENLGLITELGLVLGPGLTAVTGETGAGKTMLVEAIGLIVGNRADPSMVRAGASEARVEGRFVVDGEEMVLARVVPVEGRSRAYIDGRLATAATLAAEGARLLDRHGQHEPQSLLHSATQRDALDHFGAVDLEPLRAARRRLTELDAALAALGGDARARAREVDLLRFQVDELEAAGLRGADEDEALEREEDVLAGAGEYRDAAARAVGALADDGGATDTLGAALAAVAGRAPFAGAEARLRSLLAEVADLGHDLRAAGEAIEDDPERLGALRERRQLLRELRRKYGERLADVLAYRDEVSARLADLEGFEARAAQLDAERRVVEAEEAARAVEILAARRGAAPALGTAVGQHLRRLAMGKARVEIVVEEPAPGDAVTFLLGANVGEAALPLAKVASGGELARAMLALRLVLAGVWPAAGSPGGVETLVFDEVDAGVGGEAALAVGRALATLGQRHQVLVVTHLAQVAACADTQVAVSKRVAKGRTTATAVPVVGDDRVRELSRMLSGMSDSGSAKRHAMDLLAAAREQGR